MKRYKVITQPVKSSDLSFEDLFEEAYDKIKHDWQKEPAHPRTKKRKSDKNKLSYD